MSFIRCQFQTTSFLEKNARDRAEAAGLSLTPHSQVAAQLPMPGSNISAQELTDVSTAWLSPGPAVIKLFEYENELKCKNRLCDFIETLCLFSNI